MSSWTIYGAKGERNAIKTRLQSDDTLPAAVKSFLQEQIDLLPPECFAVKLDAYGVTDDQPGRDIHHHAQITLVGLRA